MNGIEEMTKEEICKLVNGWIDEGKIVQKSAIIKGGHWYAVWKSVERGEVFFTSHERIVATDRETRDRFQELLNSGRVMSAAVVTIRHPECASARSISKLVEHGRLLRIGKFSSVTLYVE